MINPAGVQHQIHGNVLQTTSRALKERVDVDPQTRRGRQPRVGQLPDPELPRGAGHRRADDAAARRAAARRRRVVVGAGHGGDRQRDLRRHRRALPRAAVHAGGGARGAGHRRSRRPRRLRRAAGAASTRCRRRGARPQRGAGVWAAAGALAAGVVGFGAALFGCAAGDRADRRAPTVALQRRDASSAAACSPRPATASSATPRPAAQPTPAAVRWRRRSARSTAPTSRPIRDTGIGSWSLQRLPARDARRPVARRPPPLPGLPVHRLRAHRRRRPDRALRVPDVAAARSRDDARQRRCASRSTCGRCWRLWNALFHDAAPVQPSPRSSAEWNRGAYLVNGIGHCGACHTPRNALGAERGGSALPRRRAGRRLGGASR